MKGPAGRKSLPTLASEGGVRGTCPLYIFKTSAKKVAFLDASGKKKFHHFLLHLEKSPCAPPRKKSFPRPCLPTYFAAVHEHSFATAFVLTLALSTIENILEAARSHRRFQT